MKKFDEFDKTNEGIITDIRNRIENFNRFGDQMTDTQKEIIGIFRALVHLNDGVEMVDGGVKILRGDNEYYLFTKGKVLFPSGSKINIDSDIARELYYEFLKNKKTNESLRDKMTPKTPAQIRRVKKRPIQNKEGEYRWIFSWKNGGGNDVWAKDKRVAKRLAFEMGLPSWMPDNPYSKKTLNDIKEEFGLAGYRYCKKQEPDVKDDEPGWSSGLKPNMDTLRKETLGVKGEHDRGLDMLAR